MNLASGSECISTANTIQDEVVCLRSRVLMFASLGAKASLNVRRSTRQFAEGVFTGSYRLQLQRDDLRCAALTIHLYTHYMGMPPDLRFLDGSSYVALLSSRFSRRHGREMALALFGPRQRPSDNGFRGGRLESVQ